MAFWGPPRAGLARGRYDPGLARVPRLHPRKGLTAFFGISAASLIPTSRFQRDFGWHVGPPWRLAPPAWRCAPFGLLRTPTQRWAQKSHGQSTVLTPLELKHHFDVKSRGTLSLKQNRICS